MLVGVVSRADTQANLMLLFCQSQTVQKGHPSQTCFHPFPFPCLYQRPLEMASEVCSSSSQDPQLSETADPQYSRP